MHNETDIDILKQYIDRTKQILDLSSPQLDGIKNAEEYRHVLTESFTKIGQLAQKNNAVLNRHFYPLVDNSAKLTSDEIQTLREFSASLIDTTSMENLDLPLIHMQAQRMLSEARERKDQREIILALDSMVISAYMMLNLTLRLYPDCDLCFRYRDIGLSAARELLTYLEKERFLALPDNECRELVLINSRYIRALFEWEDQPDKESVNAQDIALMRRALEVADDPFYRALAPDYKWDIHVFRTLQYLSDFTEYHNRHGFSAAQLKEIAGYTRRLISFLEEHPELEEGCPRQEQTLYLLRNTYFAGEISLAEYREGLLSVFSERDAKDYTARSMFINFIVPYEYILTLDKRSLSGDEMKKLGEIYACMAQYAYHMPKTGVLSFMVTFLSDVLKHYIEVPGGVSFEDMCLKLIAAMHPPTYVHTLSVADFTVFLTAHLLKREPERFIGICGVNQASDVPEKRTAILDFVYHAALMHDIGKLLIIETIITYGRQLPKEELALIKTHPVTGASLLKRYPGTARYADFALGHHKWFNGAGGYPESADIEHPENRVLLSLLTAADCLDAATDSVGRSYKKGKTLDECIAELLAESGTRYAPYVVEMLNDPAIRGGLERLVNVNRQENYRKTFVTLKEL